MSLIDETHLRHDLLDILGELLGRDAGNRDLEPTVQRLIALVEVERSKVLLRMPELKGTAE